MVSDDANVLFLSLFLGHIVGDFFLQPDYWVKDKVDKKIKIQILSYSCSSSRFGIGINF
jgi:hypothetical protein